MLFRSIAGLRTGAGAGDDPAVRFLRFRPARAIREAGEAKPLPNIRLDRAIEFLIGDRLT